MTDKVSIVLPTLNGARYIRQSVESCLLQTHANIELIIVDGGSSDGTIDIVQSISDPRIKIVHQTNNEGRLPGALNLGFANATGEFFTWTQDDDYYTYNAIEIMHDYLERHPDVGFVYAGYWAIDESGQVLYEFGNGSPEDLFYSNPVGHCFLYRRSVAEQVGQYDVDYFMSEDTNYWMRIYKCAKMMHVPGCYFFHRLHKDSLTFRDYGCFYAWRVAAYSRRQVLRIGWREYHRQVAAAFIEEAFAAYANRDWARVRKCLAMGLLQNPAWLKNRGVSSIGIQSVLGSNAIDIYHCTKQYLSRMKWTGGVLT